VSFDSRGRAMKFAPGISSGDHIAHRAGAEHQRFELAARIQQAVGEDVSAFRIGGKLDLVDRQKIDIDLTRHRLDGRDPVPRPLGLDLFLAGDQRNFIGSDPLHDLVVNFAGEEAQRQADHAGLVVEHPLDCEVRLSRVGRSEDSGDRAALRRVIRHGRPFLSAPNANARWHCRQVRQDQACRLPS
jgi:hypothetical protein